MKIAVPTKEGRVDDHFGHCAYYTIAEVGDDNRIIASSALPSPQGCGCKTNIAGTLREMGVTVMLAGNMGQGAVDKLSANNIEVVRGCSGDAMEVISQYAHGLISDNAKVCRNHTCE